MGEGKHDSLEMSVASVIDVITHSPVLRELEPGLKA
jgi:hypothetical protein